MTTVNSPFLFADLQGDLGHSYVFAAQEILETLEDELNVLGLGIVPLVGELSGSGSDIVRITHMGNIGWGVRFDALAVETDTITPKSITTGYSTASIAMYGLGHSESYKSQVLGREAAVMLDQLKTRVPQSWLATMRYLVAQAIQGFGTAVGSATTRLSVDDLIDLATVYTEQLGSVKRGPPTLFLDPSQVTQAKESARLEPAFQGSIAEFGAVQGLDQRQIIENFLGMGFKVALSDDIQQSGGAYQGGAFSAGGVGWVVASTMNVRPANPQGAFMVPQFGMIIEELPDSARQGKREYNARTLFGVAAGSSDVHVQRRVISVV